MLNDIGRYGMVRSDEEWGILGDLNLFLGMNRDFFFFCGNRSGEKVDFLVDRNFGE